MYDVQGTIAFGVVIVIFMIIGYYICRLEV